MKNAEWIFFVIVITILFYLYVDIFGVFVTILIWLFLFIIFGSTLLVLHLINRK